MRREPRPVGVRFLRVTASARASDRAALSPIAWAPAGDRFAYGTTDGLWVQAPGGTARRVTDGGVVTAVAWSRAADVLAYIDRGALFTVRPDGGARRRIPLDGPAALPAWAPGGDRLAVAVRLPDPAGWRLWLASPTGAMRRAVPWSPGRHAVAALEWYPDALHLFVALAAPGSEVITEWWRVRIAYPDHRRLPAPAAQVLEARLSPTGGWMGFVAAEAGGERPYAVRPDGSGRRPLGPVVRRVTGLAWAPHGESLAYAAVVDGGRVEVQVVSPTSDGRLVAATYRPETGDPAAGLSLAWSPDGRALAYGTNTGSTTGVVWLARFADR